MDRKSFDNYYPDNPELYNQVITPHVSEEDGFVELEDVVRRNTFEKNLKQINNSTYPEIIEYTSWLKLISALAIGIVIGGIGIYATILWAALR